MIISSCQLINAVYIYQNAIDFNFLRDVTEKIVLMNSKMISTFSK